MNMIERLSVLTPQGPSGELSVTPARDYLLRYEIGALPQAQISLTMGVRDAGFTSRVLQPIFQMNLPEGYVLEQLRNRLAKITAVNPMLPLALTSSASPIGRVTVQSDVIRSLQLRDEQPGGENLAQILAWDGCYAPITCLE